MIDVVYAQGHFAILLIASSRQSRNLQSLESHNQNPTYDIYKYMQTPNLGEITITMPQIHHGEHIKYELRKSKAIPTHSIATTITFLREIYLQIQLLS